MKSQAECWKALLDGETLFKEGGSRYKFIDGELQVKLDSDNGFMPSGNGFITPENYEIYSKPKWYENIPEGGVLCWVSDNSGRDEVDLISDYLPELIYKFNGEVVRWKNATPLTKKEIQVYLDNVPEEA